ncbi:MAG: hypothetical protein E7510_07250 [Ruminococcus sp.]|nr:hypothetical protein [Ruminococcus sp.]
MPDFYEDTEMVSQYFDQYDETFNWFVPEEKDVYKEQLIKETNGNPHLYIHKYATSAVVLAKHKQRNDVLFGLPNGEYALVHLTYGDKSAGNELHFIFFSTCNSALKYIEKQYKTECLGEKAFKLGSKDKTEIFIFLLQLLLFFIVPKEAKGFTMIISGVILYVMILCDWKSSGFNLFRDRKLYHSKVIPLLRYQIAYVSVITCFMVIGAIIYVISGVVIK